MSATFWKYFPTYSDESRGILFLILSGNSLLTYVDVIDLSVCISRYVSYVGRRMAQQEGELFVTLFLLLYLSVLYEYLSFSLDDRSFLFLLLFSGV